MSMLKGADTSKRWWLAKKAMLAVGLIGGIGFTLFFALGAYAFFTAGAIELLKISSSILITTIGGEVTLGSMYKISEAWSPHDPGNESTIVINQGGGDIDYQESNGKLPPSPYKETR